MSLLPTVLPIRTILAATDLSPASAPAVHAAAVLAKEYGAALHLVHALPDHPDPRLDILAEGFADKLAAEIRKELTAFSEQVPGGAATFTKVEARRGRPSEVILQDAGQIGADLLVLGTHGRTGLEHLALGSVAEHLAAVAPMDVLLVRKALAGPYRRPALALSNSPAALRAAARALEVMDVCGAASLDVTAAYDLPLGWHASTRTAEEIGDRMRAFTEEDLAPVVAELESSAKAPVRFACEQGGAAEVVLARVERAGNDLLLAGSATRSAWTSALLGGTARTFAHRAPCSTWLVRDTTEQHPIRDAILRDLGLA